jgi:hypothetical protein
MTMMLDRNGPGIGLGGKTPGPGHPEPWRKGPDQVIAREELRRRGLLHFRLASLSL